MAAAGGAGGGAGAGAGGGARAGSELSTGAAGEFPLPAPVIGERNPTGIPSMVFLEDIDGFMGDHRVPIESLLQALQIMHSKYKFMEANLVESRSRLQLKMPNIERSLEVISLLEAKKAAAETMSTDFFLSDTIYAKADVEPCDRVCLWLGAGVMLEYTYSEAKKLLTDNLEGAKTKLERTQADIAFVRDQVITTEVNIARVYNLDVKKRRSGEVKAA